MELVNVSEAHQEVGVSELQLGGWRHTVHLNSVSLWLKGAMKLCKGGEFGEKLSDQQLHRKDSAPR